MNLQVAGPAIAVELALVLAYVSKLRRLKFETFERWKRRVEIAKTQLNDLAVDAALEFQKSLNRALDGLVDGTDQSLRLDPKSFSSDVSALANLLARRADLETYYPRLKKVCPYVSFALLSVLISFPMLVLVTAWRSGPVSWLLAIAVVVFGCGLLVLATAGAMYFRYEHRLDRAVMAGDGDSG